MTSPKSLHELSKLLVRCSLNNKFCNQYREWSQHLDGSSQSTEDELAKLEQDVYRLRYLYSLFVREKEIRAIKQRKKSKPTKAFLSAQKSFCSCNKRNLITGPLSEDEVKAKTAMEQQTTPPKKPNPKHTRSSSRSIESAKITKRSHHRRDKIGRAVQQECRDRSRMPSSA
eukprot:TRINITY_DN31956_c0_g1_i2.p1 TRINITY_DN31956_c0_g1~~TRINITY_DN31956_c0_g1_i2.p1  ORF type:complete len:171 (+),score=4.94 TRINITY_DN31956_c0_g1_i2:24-536(+)